MFSGPARKGLEKVGVTPEAEQQILTFQSRQVQLCSRFKELCRILTGIPPDQPDQRNLCRQELNKVHNQILTTDKLLKGVLEVGRISQTDVDVTPDATPVAHCSKYLPPILSSSDGLPQPVAKKSRPPSLPPSVTGIHPSTVVTQDDFLGGLGLMTLEAYNQKKLQSAKVERRRRTATINPKYSSNNGFLKPEELTTRRSKRLESNQSGKLPDCEFQEPVVSSFPIPSCQVCHGRDFDLTCESCHSKTHASCIQVTGSNAPIPHRLPVCPKCVEARVVSQMERIQKKTPRIPPSIMLSPAKGITTPPKPAVAKGLSTRTNPSKVKRSDSSTIDAEKKKTNSKAKIVNPKSTLTPKRKVRSIQLKANGCGTRSRTVSKALLTKAKRKRQRQRPPREKVDITVIQKTIRAMSAAATAVMSNPMKYNDNEEEEQHENDDSVMESISSVIDWTKDEKSLIALSANQESTDTLLYVCASKLEGQVLVELDDDDTSDNTLPSVTIADQPENGKSDNSACSNSVRGQPTSDDDLEEEEEEELLSIGNSPVHCPWEDEDKVVKPDIITA